MRKQIAYTGLSLLLFVAAQAQDKKSKWKYTSLTQLGLLTGSSTISYSAQTIQGVGKANWFAGAGVGLEEYGVPGFPIVMHVQKAFSNRKAKPFVYAQSGIQLPWKKKEWDVKTWIGTEQYKLYNGFLAEAGAGYLIKLGKEVTLCTSASYSYKHNKVRETVPLWSDWPPYNNEMYNILHFDYRRIAIKAGFYFRGIDSFSKSSIL